MKEITKKFNEIRINNQNVLFNKEQLKDLFKDFPYKQFKLFLTEAVNNLALIRVDTKHGLYKFTEYPVHMDTIQRIINKVQKKINQYNTTYYQNNKTKIKTKTSEQPSLTSQEAIDAAIKVLLANGYEVFKVETIVKRTQITGVLRYLRVGEQRKGLCFWRHKHFVAKRGVYIYVFADFSHNLMILN